MIECSADIRLLAVDEWREFVKNHPQGNIFQSPLFFRAMEGTGVECLGAFARCSGKLSGVVLAVIQRQTDVFSRIFSSRAIVIGGPLVDPLDRQAADNIISMLTKAAGEKAIYTQWRNLFDAKEYYNSFIANGYTFEEHLDIHIDLEKDEDELWREVQSKRRNEIRRAGREGTQFGEAVSPMEEERTYEILRGVYGKARLPLPGYDYFSGIRSVLGPQVFRIFTAKADGRVIGTMYALCFKDVIYDWYAGGDSAYFHKHPNDLIPWEVFLWGKRNGFKRFVFGGAGKPGVFYGVRDYKKQFGGEFVGFGRFERINKPVMLRLAKAGFFFWKHCQRHE